MLLGIKFARQEITPPRKISKGYFSLSCRTFQGHFKSNFNNKTSPSEIKNNLKRFLGLRSRRPATGARVSRGVSPRLSQKTGCPKECPMGVPGFLRAPWFRSVQKVSPECRDTFWTLQSLTLGIVFGTPPFSGTLSGPPRTLGPEGPERPL